MRMGFVNSAKHPYPSEQLNIYSYFFVSQYEIWQMKSTDLSFYKSYINRKCRFNYSAANNYPIGDDVCSISLWNEEVN